MIKFRKTRYFECDLEKAWRILVELEQGYDLNELDDIAMWRRVKREDDGVTRKDVNEWCAHAQLPKVVQAIVPPKALTWYDFSEIHRPTKTLKFTVQPIALKGKVDCHGTTVFKAEGPNSFSRHFEISLNVKLPLVGNIAEAFVIDLLKKNEEVDYRLCVKALGAAEKIKSA